MGRRKPKYVKSLAELVPENIQRDWKEEQDEELKLRQLVKPKTKNHEKLINSILTNTITFITGPAGTGKTFITCGVAAKLLIEGKINKIVLTRPQVEVGGQTMGYLPGSSIEKIMPYMVPLVDALSFFIGTKEVDRLIKDEIIQIIPVGLIRGHSIKNSMIILDEAQDMTYLALKTLLTRLDVGSRLVLAGDLNQSDLRTYENDFQKVIDKLYELKDEIGFVHFTLDDIQRAGIIRKILERL